MPVYIQSHAQQRLAERLDCLEQGYVEFFVYNSLKNLKYFKDKNGNPLIEYNYFGFKTGYLRADIHHGKIIIRTFLFLTNNGTPEGEKLNEFTGLSKLDHKYLNIDKLSTFMSADIRNNIEVKDIFVRAGCKSLFDIDANFIFDTKHGTNPVAAMNLSKYIKMPETESSLNAMSGLPINPQL
jgi:hypothetical protein